MAAGDAKSAGRSWDEVRKELFTPDEIESSDRRVVDISEKIRAGKAGE